MITTRRVAIAGCYHPMEKHDLIESRRSALECTECGARFTSTEDANDHAEQHGGDDVRG